MRKLCRVSKARSLEVHHGMSVYTNSTCQKFAIRPAVKQSFYPILNLATSGTIGLVG
jgi:hypothetical protein